jgi:DNA-binding GntR family transcriptional regulator
MALPPSQRAEAGAKAPYEKLKSAILRGELAPGEQLVESMMASYCGVSRTPVREALTRLEQDGLVSRTDRGLVVRESSQEEILDIYETRIVLESTAATFAAERRTNHDMIAMRKAEERGLRLGKKASPVDAAERNRDFHRTIWRASRNISLIDLLERVNLHLGRYPETTLTFPGRYESSHEEHHDLIEAIEERDPERAGKIASNHFSTARDIRLRLWENE